ncbi:MAG: TIGR03619 family F420-dependent LLM class oxidoreductase [bacterium]|nr:TIGR03619 family F420-dependent LLM class oxidoreductase [bacterium]
MRIGVTLPGYGADQPVSITDAARMAERMGFDSIWNTDHVVMVAGAASPYPFDADGVMRWDLDHPMFDALIALASAVAVTTHVEVGTCVLIAPMRNPIVLAKQVSTLDVISGGRFVLGVGVGWLAEEFAALDAPFKDRGTRMDDWIDILRDCWTGTPAARSYAHYEVPEGIRCYPTPLREPPILVGGDSPPVLRRTARRGDGWLGFSYTDELDPARIGNSIESIRIEAAAAGRKAPTRLAVQTPGPVAPLAEQLADLARQGVTEVVTSADWTAPDRVRDGLNLLRRSA